MCDNTREVSKSIIKGWKFRKCGTSQWHDASEQSNGNQVHLDLLHNNLIPDPFVDDNERLVQWVGKSDWEYKTDFEVESIDKKVFRLVIEGLDTYAHVYFNGAEVAACDNMFRTYDLNVADIIGRHNTLSIKFKSGLNEGRKVEQQERKLQCSNGETSRLYVRKAQYHYGWDWGPLLLTCGPSKPVKLVSYDYGKIEDFYIKYSITDDNNVNVDAISYIDLPKDGLSLQLRVASPGGSIERVVEIDCKAKNSISEVYSNPELWFPKGYGKQNFYTFKLSVLEGSRTIDTIVRKVGFRKAEVVKEGIKDGKGTSFYFRINDIPIFANGSNWIPAHSFSSALSKEDYSKWIDIIDKGNQNMIRVWGGGFFENDAIYEECDNRGILVWQDFMFACGVYPGEKDFKESVEREVSDQLKRLSKYSSIVLYAGNNEDYQYAESLGIYPSSSEMKMDDPRFPAKSIYEELLPELVRKYTNNVYYQPSSPYSGPNVLTSDLIHGDVHQWNVWHGSQEKYQNWDKLMGRFVSEFGMLAAPNIATLKKVITDPEQWYPQSYLMDQHNKSEGFERRLAIYLNENFQIESMSLEKWIYLTQAMQSDCLTFAYRYWRREWGKDHNRKCGGALVWQANDCWPVTSWSIVDFNHVPKLAYYAIKRECKPLTIGIHRKETRVPDPLEPEDLSKQTPLHDFAEKKHSFDLWAVNVTLSPFEGYVNLELYNTEHRILQIPKVNVTVPPNSSLDILLDYKLHDPKNKLIVYAELVDLQGNVVHSTSDWPQPLKYIVWPEDTRISHTVDPKAQTLTLSVNRPVKCADVLVDPNSLSSLHSSLSDNGMDLFPGHDYIIRTTLSSDEIKGVQSLSSW